MDDLHRAALKGDTDTCRDLILKGVQIDAKETGDFWTPLRYAVAGGHAAACVVLVEAGANLDIADKHGWTPIAHADFKGHKLAADLYSARARRVAQQVLDALGN
jgi:ankyrin repeat protein